MRRLAIPLFLLLSGAALLAAERTYRITVNGQTTTITGDILIEDITPPITQPPAAPVITLSAEMNAAGTEATATWAVTGADDVTLNGAAVAHAGTQTAQGAGPHTFTVAAAKHWTGGTVSASQSATVVYVPPPGDVPPVGSDVNITTHVIAGANWDVDEITVQDGGTLELAPNASVTIEYRKLTVLAGGSLILDPASETIIHWLKMKSVPDNGTFLFGNVDWIGSDKTDFARLAVEPQTGHTTLTFAVPVIGWRVGDKLVLPDSRHWETWYPWWLPQDQVSEHGAPGWGGPDHIERRTVAAVSPDGLTVTLDAPLSKPHPGARFLDSGPVEALPHVVNLTRNVKVTSTVADSDDRGFVEVKDRADFTSHNVEFRSLGQSKVASKGLTFGNHRCPLTLHHLYGPVGGQPGGYAAEIVGCSFWCGLPSHWFKGPSLHDSHYTLWKDCVSFNWAGWSYGTWHANESYNRFENCFALFGRGVGDNVGSPGERGDEVGGFYLAGPLDTLVNCVSANCVSVPGYGFAAYGVKLNNIGGLHQIPTALGCPSFTTQDIRALPLGGWHGTEVYGQENGMTLWFLNASNSMTVNQTAESYITNTKVWNTAKYGCFLYPAAGLTFDGWWHRGRRFLMDKQSSTCLTSGDYYAGRQVLKNFDVKGCMFGWGDPTYGAGSSEAVVEHLVENFHSDCWYDFGYSSIRAPGSGGHGSNRKPRKITLKNCTASDKTGWTSDHIGPPAKIRLELRLEEAVNLAVSNRLLLEGWEGQNYEVFFNEQHPDTIMPQTDSQPGLFASPVAGLTNAQNLAQHGVCWAGALMPADAIALPGLIGGKAK